MPDITAAGWSAVAASFAALAAFLTMLIHRWNLIESVRPELVLTGWTRNVEGQGDAAHEVIGFQAIKNVGRGAALHIHMNVVHVVIDRAAAIMETIRIPILGTNEASEVNGRISVWWNNVEARGGFKHLGITIGILCLDSRGGRRETLYKLFVVELAQPGGVVNPIAPGVALTSRTTVRRPVWWLRFSRKIQYIRFRPSKFRDFWSALRGGSGRASGLFLSTLAQITATFLALIVAGIFAYVIFLQERAARFDEEIAQRRLEIRSGLSKLSIEWRQFAFLPQEFAETYRARYPKTSRIELTKQAGSDLLFRKPELASALAEAQPHDSFGGPNAGRVYIWVLGQLVARALADLIPAHGGETVEVFPVTGTELGFHEWRRDYLQVYGTLVLISGDHPVFLSDLLLFVEGAKQRYPNLEQIRQTVKNDIEALYRRMAEIRASIDHIDKQVYLSAPYRLTERFRWRWLIVFLSLAVLAGIVVPMFMIGARQLWSIVLGALTVACLVVVFVAFWESVGTTRRPLQGDYLRERWYKPLAYLLKRHQSGIANRARLETTLLWDALNRPERQQFPTALVTRLEEHLHAADRYNRTSDAVSADIATKLRQDQALARLVGSSSAGGSNAPNVLEIANPDLRQRLEKQLASAPDTQISFETARRRTVLTLRRGLSQQETASLLAVLDRLQAEVSGMRQFKEFENIVEALNGPLAALRSTIEPLLH